jgi:hypothetical protein
MSITFNFISFGLSAVEALAVTLSQCPLKQKSNWLGSHRSSGRGTSHRNNSHFKSSRRNNRNTNAANVRSCGFLGRSDHVRAVACRMDSLPI